MSSQELCIQVEHGKTLWRVLERVECWLYISFVVREQEHKSTLYTNTIEILLTASFKNKFFEVQGTQDL